MLMAASALSILGASVALAYDGRLGPTEYVGNPKQATDYKNPLPVAGRPHHYHVSICNDGSWYGVWHPAEWQGNADGRVRGTPSGHNQHGYAKEEDGTGGGVQIMGNGKGGDNQEITLHKENGETVYLLIHVIDCSHRAVGPRGLLANAGANFPYSPMPAHNGLFPTDGFGGLLLPNDERINRPSVMPGTGYGANALTLGAAAETRH
jgi:hypothetical protein